MLTTALVPASSDIYSLSAMVPGPGMLLPVNAYCVRGKEPTLIDAGLPPMSAEFRTALWDLIDPADLKWIVITHDDRDHIGSFPEILEEARHATVITNFTSMIRIAEDWQMPLDRIRLVNPGDRVNIGDDVLEAFRPPTYDSPGTLGFHALQRNVCFTSDSLGAFLPASVEAGMLADDVVADEYHDGAAIFASALSPWLHDIGEQCWHETVAALRERQASALLSTHGLPVVTGIDALLDAFVRTHTTAAYVPPAQEAIDLMLSMNSPQS